MSEPFPKLKPGQRFRLPPDCGVDSTFVVLRVSDCSATVRPLASEHVVIPGPEGEPRADFWRPGRALQICPRPSVILLEES